MEPRIQYAQTASGVSIAFRALREMMPLVHLPVFVWHHAQLAVDADRPLAQARAILQEFHQGTRRRKRCLGKT